MSIKLQKHQIKEFILVVYTYLKSETWEIHDCGVHQNINVFGLYLMQLTYI